MLNDLSFLLFTRHFGFVELGNVTNTKFSILGLSPGYDSSAVVVVANQGQEVIGGTSHLFEEQRMNGGVNAQHFGNFFQIKLLYLLGYKAA